MSPGDAPGHAAGGHAGVAAARPVNGNGATTPGAIAVPIGRVPVRFLQEQEQAAAAASRR